MRKAPKLPSDHPQIQGMKDTPTINQKSIQILEKKHKQSIGEGGEAPYDSKVHNRLYN